MYMHLSKERNIVIYILYIYTHISPHTYMSSYAIICIEEVYNMLSPSTWNAPTTASCPRSAPNLHLKARHHLTEAPKHAGNVAS